MRLRGTNFCTSLARFAPTCARQTNGPKCTQIVRNAPKNQFRVQWGGSGAFIAKHSDSTLWHKLLHKFGPFCTEFGKATKWSQIVRNAEKCQFRVQGVYRERLLRKIPTRLRGSNFCTSSSRFAPSSVRQQNSLKCTQIVWNAPKRQFSVL